MLGIRTVGKTDRYVWTDRYLGTLVSRGVPVVTTCVEYYADGVEQKDMVYRDLDVEGGDVYTPVDIATQKALKDTCNLNGQYGQNPRRASRAGSSTPSSPSPRRASPSSRTRR